MNCCVIGCERQARHTYKIKEVKFSYCKKHKYIPDNMMSKVKYGFYKGYGKKEV